MVLFTFSNEFDNSFVRLSKVGESFNVITEFESPEIGGENSDLVFSTLPEALQKFQELCANEIAAVTSSI